MIGAKTSLLHGWLPALVTVSAWAALTVGVAWRRRALWQWLVIAGAAAVCVLVLQVVLDVPARVAGTYPKSFLLWAALPLFALGAAVWQWPEVAWWRRLTALASVPCLLAFGALQINAHYAYLPTLGDALGAPVPGQVRASQLPNVAHRRVPTTGVVAHIDIPAPVSRLVHRRGYVWLPPSYFATPRPPLSVLMLLAGVPGDPSDWLRGGRASAVANAWAATHHGNAPLMVFPDPNGHLTGDTECVDGARGAAETYLSVDVPTFMHTRFGVPLDRQRWAVAGLSEGGTCALELASRHPDLFATFADYSGDAAPRIGDEANTIRVLYGGSTRAWTLHDPSAWFALDAAYGTEGVIVCGSRDRGYLPREREITAIAQRSRLRVSLVVVPGGGHSFRLWAQALAVTYPWIASRLQQIRA